MKLSSPIFWFIGCTILLLLAFGGFSVSSSQGSGGFFVISFGAMIAGVFGMIASFILAFRKAETKPAISFTTEEKKQKHFYSLTTACIVHAALITLALFWALKNSGNVHSLLIYTWWTMLAAWPLWIIPFLMLRWPTNRIMITMIAGLLIISPALFILLIASAMGRGC